MTILNECFNRRAFFSGSIAAPAGLAAARLPAAETFSGAQLYTVRQEAQARDLPPSSKLSKDRLHGGRDLRDIYGHPAAELRRID